jgi:hypothetical protein
MAELSDDEKKRLVNEAAQILMPLSVKYELDTVTGRAALYEAFQLGIQFSIRETKRIEEDLKDGQY